MTSTCTREEPTGTGTVSFVGSGPGAADLLTLRAARVIGEADVVVWAASLVHPDVLAHARADARIVDSSLLPMEGVLPLYQEAARDGLTVARIHSGDPSLWEPCRNNSTCAWPWDWPSRSCPGSPRSRRWRRSSSAS